MEVTDATFAAEVLDRSATEPVVVDFWAEWCAPCTRFGPVLEAALAERGVSLAKIDVDANRELADRFQVSGIPAVKAFRNGEVVGEFVGARGRAGIDAFLDELLRPPVADSLAGDEELAAPLRAGDYERAFEILLARVEDPATRDAARSLMVELFGELGQGHPLATTYRRRLATLLY
jgi:putative thioredoxin